jgi:hypothetical protein
MVTFDSLMLQTNPTLEPAPPISHRRKSEFSLSWRGDYATDTQEGAAKNCSSSGIRRTSKMLYVAVTLRLRSERNPYEPECLLLELGPGRRFRPLAELRCGLTVDG